MWINLTMISTKIGKKKIDETTVLGMYTLLHWYQITALFPPQNKMFLFSTMYSSDIYLCMHKILHN